MISINYTLFTRYKKNYNRETRLKKKPNPGVETATTNKATPISAYFVCFGVEVSALSKGCRVTGARLDTFGGAMVLTFTKIEQKHSIYFSIYIPVLIGFQLI